MADKQICSACGKNGDSTRDFYTSFSPFHKHTGKLHICKQCVTDGMDKNNLELVLNTLRSLDKPFITKLWESAIDKNNHVGEYFKLINAKDFRNSTWADSDHVYRQTETHVQNVNSFSQDDHDMVEDNKSYLLKFWGRGFNADDLIWLQTEYEDWTNRYECDSKGMETLIKQICLVQLDIEKRRAANEKVDQQLKTLQDLLGSSNLKPVQETGANAVEQETFGTLIKKFENEKPIPEADPKWKDVDKIGKYVKVFFLGHLTRMLGLKNEYEDEYWDEMNKYTVDEPIEDEEIEEIENGRN
jgi:hypothetical protein